MQYIFGDRWVFFGVKWGKNKVLGFLKAILGVYIENKGIY